jgi:uncharacterized repeat protein (TIGR02543 family)
MANAQEIEFGTFAGCAQMKVDPEKFAQLEIETIRTAAFSGAASIEKLQLPDSVETIECYAFDGCTALKEFTTTESSALSRVDYGVFGYACDGFLPDASSNMDCITPIDNDESGHYAAYQAKLDKHAAPIQKLVLPAAIFNGLMERSSGSGYHPGMMAGNRHLNEVVLHPYQEEYEGDATILYRTFAGCTSLKEFTLPDNVKRIGHQAFAGCSSLETFTATEDSRLAYVEGQAFGYNIANFDRDGNALEISISNFQTADGRLSKYGAPLKKVTLPCDVSLACGTFAGDEALEQVIFLAKPGDKEATNQTFSCQLFAYCKNLKTIRYQKGDEIQEIIPDNITYIGYGAFAGSGLEKLVTTVKSRLSSFGYAVFGGTEASYGQDGKKLAVGDSYNKTMKTQVAPVKEAVLPCDVYLPIGAFAGDTALEHVAFFEREGTTPNDSYVQFQQFLGCTNLQDFTYLKFDEESKSLRVYKTLPDNIHYIDKGAFEGCSSLKTVDFTKDSELQGFGYGAFGCANWIVPYFPAGVEKITIPKGVSSLQTALFNGNTSLKEVVFADRDKENEINRSIEYSAFKGCSNLTKVEGLKNVDVIKESAFRDCTSLASIDLEGVNNIACEAFENTALKEVTIPKSVNYVAPLAFQNCPQLKKITIQSLLNKSEGKYDMYGNISIPDMIGAYYDVYQSVTEQIENPLLSAEETVERFGDNVTIPEELEIDGVLVDEQNGIYASAFDFADKQETIFAGYLAGLKKVTFKNVPAISYKAFFADYNLESVEEITDSVSENSVGENSAKTDGSSYLKKIGDYAFMCCHKLDVDLEQFTALEEIGDYAFQILHPYGGVPYIEVKAMESIVLPMDKEDGFSKIVLPASIKYVGDSAFFGQRNADKIVLPRSLKECGKSAFGYTKPQEIVFNCSTGILPLDQDGDEPGFDQLFWNGRDGSLKKITYDYVAGDDDTDETSDNEKKVGIKSAEVAKAEQKNKAEQEKEKKEEKKAEKKAKKLIEDGFCHAEFFGQSVEECIINVDNLERLPYCFLMNNKKLKSFTITSSVKEIGVAAFKNDKALKSIDIPVNVEYIGPDAFAGSGLEKIYFYNEDVEIEDDTWKDSPLRMINEKRTIPVTATIYGYSDSTAQEYAEEYGNKFVALDSKKIVTIDTNGGSDMETLNLEAGRTVGELDEPIKTDYTFDGWYSDEELTNEFDPETPINEDTTIYAKWKKTLPVGAPKTEMTISYNRNQTIGDIKLGDNWKWEEQKEDVLVRPGKTVSAQAEYVGTDADQYAVTTVTVTITMNKESAPETAPEIPSEEISVSYSIQKVGDVALPADWMWKKADRDKALEVGVAVQATAVYVGEDKGSYNVESVSVTLTKKACEHKPKAAVKENEVRAEIGKEGSYDEVVYCAICGEEISREKKTIAAYKPGYHDLDPAGKLPAAVGTILTDAASGAEYIVTSADQNNPTVSLKKLQNTKAKTFKMPAQITNDGITYKVTGIADKVFAKNNKLKKVTIGMNVETIGKQAFAKCTALKNVTIPQNVTTIGKQAFTGCKNLKKITIKSTSLTAKSIGGKAFKGIHAKAVIKVPKANKKAYDKILRKKGIGKEAKVK